MKREWVVFFYHDRELLRYTLRNEADGEREATIELLAYENNLSPSEICFAIITR